jgi:hypothetical protein
MADLVDADDCCCGVVATDQFLAEDVRDIVERE